MENDGEAEVNGGWAASGNAFGLGTIQTDSDLHGRNVEAITNHIPSMYVECMAPAIYDGTVTHVG